MTPARFLAVAAAVVIAACGPSASRPGGPGASTALASSPSQGILPTSSASAGTLPPASSADAGWIAFVEGTGSDADTVIRVIRPDGSDQRLVPRTGASQTEGPAWIPGTAVLLFDSSRAGSIHLFRFDIQTGGVSQLTSGDRFEGYPAASPDGRIIAIDWGSADASLGIALMDIDGSNVHAIVPPPAFPAFDSAPAFSPDGRKIAFIRKRSQEAPNAQEAAFVVNIDGTGLRQLTPFDMDVGRIRWSPDGQWLVFSNNYENKPTHGTIDLFRVHPDASGLEQLTHNQPGFHTHDPEWSPNGTRLVAVRWHVGLDHDELVTMNLAGADVRVIATGASGTFFEWPSWSEG